MPKTGDLCGEEVESGRPAQPAGIPLAESDPYDISQQDADEVDDVAGDDDVNDGGEQEQESCEMCAPKHQAPVKTK